MKLKYFFIYLMLIILFMSCGSDSGNTPEQSSAEELTTSGWLSFEAGEYQVALQKFEDAIQIDNNYIDAYNGAGWSQGRLLNLNEAISNFLHCRDLDSLFTDASAGLAFVYNAQKNYQSAISHANKTLSQNSQWDFKHDSQLDFKDIHLLLAECYFAILDFESSLAQVQILNPDFNADLFTFEGRSALAAEIERLRGVI